ncbi:YybH family protein [Roseateles cellulosilyticus]|uniref:Nuclear transport factor 2 family protein n=1 Tax=Pelomonas cellulosilytica TaxID=2906762 RepID=A0ABS8Y2Y7_9BURK|nr:nuclear transport factor 2 family protein [Pelomonas sp. P8]MCE4557361.1 nuclear transport factor 2 family protein [Pelomonas sp. P8]
MRRSPAQQAALLASPDDTEAQFYEALQHADLDHLMALWADDEEVACILAGGARLMGLTAIRTTFESLFKRGAVHVTVERVRRLVSGDCAIHHVLERVQRPGEPQQAWVNATNVYLKTALGWRLVLHHASPGSAGDVQDLVSEAGILH